MRLIAPGVDPVLALAADVDDGDLSSRWSCALVFW
jgi:hypothetical protein